MDTTDIEIVRLLQKNGRMSHEQIAREVHLSRPAVHDRIKRLEQDDVIHGYGAQIDWNAIGLPLTAFIWVRTTTSCLAAGQSILALTNRSAVVEECHRVAGEWCLLVKTRSASSLALQDLLDAVTAVPGVQGTMTTVALSTVRESAPEEEDCVLPDKITGGAVRLQSIENSSVYGNGTAATERVRR